MLPLETEDCTLIEITPQPDARGTVLALGERLNPLYLLARWWPEGESEAWASMRHNGESFFCVAGRAEVVLLSFRRYRGLCPAAFSATAVAGASILGLPGGLPDTMDCLTETVILDANAPRLLTVGPDVFVYVKTKTLPTVLLTSMNPEGREIVRLASRFAETFLG